MNSDRKDQNNVLAEVGAALQRGDHSAAIRTLKRAVKREPNNAAYHDLMAAVYYLQAQPVKALPFSQRATALAPSVAQYLRGEASILIALDRNDEAIVKLQEVLELEPKDTDARNDLGAVFLKIGRTDAAEAQLREAVKYAPAAANAFFNLGVALFKQKKFSEAEKLFRQALDQTPDDTNKLYELAQVFWKLDCCVVADALLHKVLERKPDFVDALIVRAEIMARRGTFEAGEKLMGRARALDPKNQKLFESLGGIYQAWQKPQEAQKAFSEALEIDPMSLNALVGLSHCVPGQAGFDLCRAIDRAYAAINPKNVDLRLDLEFAKARALDMAKNHENAWRQAMKANSKFRTLYRLKEPSRIDFRREPTPGLENDANRQDLFLPPTSQQSPFIIIAGMPRSGKSSTEELLASIPGLKRGYENNIFSETIEELNERIGFKLVTVLDDLPVSYFSQFREIFTEKLAVRAGDCSAYTITIPSMYLMNNIPNIINIIPNIFIILLDRDTWDNAFRIFLYNYNLDKHRYSYSLLNIMKYIKLWRSAVDWWAKTAPERCIAVRYEDFVADPRSTIFKICVLCDLPFPDSSPKLPFDDRGCAAPYREMMQACLREEGWRDEDAATRE